MRHSPRRISLATITLCLGIFGCGGDDAPRGLGAPCEASDDCASGLCTDSIQSGTRFCTESCEGIAAGEPCGPNDSGNCMIDGGYAFCHLGCVGDGYVSSCNDFNSEMGRCGVISTTGGASVCY